MSNVGLSSAAIQFTSRQAHKVDIIYGSSESFGGIISLNTSPVESTYSPSLSGLQDGTKYFYKLITYDNENNKYESSIYSFTTLARPKITMMVQSIFRTLNSLPNMRYLLRISSMIVITH